MVLGWCVALACSGPKPVFCGSSSCTGCCDSAGHCQLGNTEALCGAAGATCVACGTGQSCAGGGQCVDGSPTDGGAGPNCGIATGCVGCCDAQGNCHSGLDDSACGNFGGNCAACPDGCQPIQGDAGGGVCACGGSNCDGCCESTTQCVPLAQETDTECGSGMQPGSACTTCAFLGVCNNGVCNNPPCAAFCQGCCEADGGCVSLSDETADQCGSTSLSGSACVSCGANGCSNGSCATPLCAEVARCAVGCCDPSSGSCVAPESQSATSCGANGTVCAPCPAPGFCDGGYCCSDGGCQ